MLRKVIVLFMAVGLLTASLLITGPESSYAHRQGHGGWEGAFVGGVFWGTVLSAPHYCCPAPVYSQLVWRKFVVGHTWQCDQYGRPVQVPIFQWRLVPPYPY